MLTNCNCWQMSNKHQGNPLICQSETGLVLQCLLWWVYLCTLVVVNIAMSSIDMLLLWVLLFWKWRHCIQHQWQHHKHHLIPGNNDLLLASSSASSPEFYPLLSGQSTMGPTSVVGCVMNFWRPICRLIMSSHKLQFKKFQIPWGKSYTRIF